VSAVLATHDPAVAAAMGRCLTARSFRDRVTRYHLRTCGWCDYPTDELRAGVEAFTRWAQFDDRVATSGRHTVRAFAHDLRDEEREALVVAAQAFEEVTSDVDVTPTSNPTRVTSHPAATNAIAGESGPRRDVAEPRRGVTSNSVPPRQHPQPEEYLPWKR
jgi:hypothetical protein